MEKKNGTNGFNIKKKLQEAIKKATDDNYVRTLETFNKSAEKTALRKEIVKEAINHLQTNRDSLNVARILEGLDSLLGDLSVDALTAHKIFEDIQKWFGQWLTEAKETENPQEIRTVEFMYNRVSLTACRFFKEMFLREFQQLDFAEQTLRIKEWQGRIYAYKFPFILCALERIQTDIEQQIAYEKEQSELKKRFEIVESKEETNVNKSNVVSISSKHIFPRNEKQVFLVLEVLLRTLKSNGNQTDKGKFMSFLSGYSAETMRQYFNYYEDWADRRANLQEIRQICLDLGMSVFAREIEKELAKLDKKQ